MSESLINGTPGIHITVLCKPQCINIDWLYTKYKGLKLGEIFYRYVSVENTIASPVISYIKNTC